ncbi:tRNA processing endoribonuclease Trz1 [Trichophyton interdigitale]|uniref:ribonuclease Z n=1 Tax=Trichophyton interdigitale TaxID=101480 RepID=A0A9P4YIE0_9EURO|nr:tRNA processing endoribonuclease Trz1 [Trichophyton interdigitale]KAF3896342.1 tRNA processing endoribonuclease Trz1 [Trichophyton interdigitale]KAG8209140.1 tRNA processing endoribonuclease Trz1 [Trichophyton interdigitale]
MKSFIQFVTAPTSDTPGTTLFLHYDDKRYFFGNLSEGTQRACIENNVRLSKLSEVFLTGKTTWAGNGGMLGMLLTLSDTMASASGAMVEAESRKIKNLEERAKAAVRQKDADELMERVKRRKLELEALPEFHGQRAISLYGGPNLTHTLATGRTFICRTGVPIEIREFGCLGCEERDATIDLSKPAWSDDHIKVWALPTYPSSSPRLQPGKRTLDDFEGGEGAAATKAAREKDLVTRQKIVLDMFNSQWRLDTLVETPLAEVSLPATLFIRDKDTGEVKPYEGPKPGDGEALPNINVLVRQPWPGAMVDSLPATTPSDCAVSYIIRGHDSRGKFDRKRAESLNIADKSDFRRLASGETVISADGKTITPDMVLGETRPGKGFAVLELPSVDYIQGIVNRKEWDNAEIMKGMEVFIWILGPGVGGHPLLQEFVAKMSKYKHIVSSPDYCADNYGFPAVSTATMELSAIDGDRYQKTFCNGEAMLPVSNFAAADTKTSVSIAQPNLTIDLEPSVKLTASSTPPSKPNKMSRRNSYSRVMGEILSQPGVQKRIEKLKASIPNGDAEIIALGTGSSCPSRYRNVSGTLLRVPGHGNYLFDAGEGTLGQLKRTFGPDELKEVLRDLRVIWISHLHADHHLGTVSVIKAWHEAVHGPLSSSPSYMDITEEDVPRILKEKRLYVVSAQHMLQWMAEYTNVENYGYDKVVPLSASSFEHPDGKTDYTYTIHRRQRNGAAIPDKDGKYLGTRLKFDDENSPFTELLKQGTGLDAILTTPVSHCQGAKAVSLVFPTGFKVSYSGDCRPSTRFIDMGRGSTVLIHEATFDDNMLSDAVAKRHSTVSEAMTVGLRMEAKVIVMTHFSQRYRKMPDIANAKEVHIQPPKGWNNKGNNAGDMKPPRQAPSVVRDIPTSEDVEEDYTMAEAEESGAAKVTRPRSRSRSKSPSSSTNNPPIVIAFDHMRLRVADAIQAEAHQPLLTKFLETTSEE